MDIRFSGKGMRATAGIKEHSEEKLLKLEKYAPRLVEAHVILKKEKYLCIAEITLLAKNFRAYGEGRVKENVFAAIDQAHDRILKQLKKYREKQKDHHKKGRLSKEGLVKDGAPPKKRRKRAPEIDPEIVLIESFSAKPMSAEEASMQLSLSDEDFLVFSNSMTNNVNVIFKRRDGKHGLIEPNF